MSKKTRKKKPPRYILLVWEQLPEMVDFYLIPREDLNDEDISVMRRCHGNYIGTDTVENDHGGKHTKEEIDMALTAISEMLLDPSADYVNGEYLERAAKQLEMSVPDFEENVMGKLISYKLDMTRARVIPRSRIVRTGYVM